VSLYVAFGVQRVRPNPFGPRSWWSWFVDPSEVNAEARLPAVTGAIYGIHVSDDGETIWLVGAERSVTRSRDAGRTWQIVDLKPFPGEGEPDVPKVDPGKGDEKKGEEKKKDVSKKVGIGRQGAYGVMPNREMFDDKPTASQKNNQAAQHPLPLKPPKGSALTGVSFDSTGKVGWIVGTYGVVYSTSDSGNTWEPIAPLSSQAPGHFVGVKATSSGALAVDSRGSLFDYRSSGEVAVFQPPAFPTAGVFFDGNDVPWLAGWMGSMNPAAGAGEVCRYIGPTTGRKNEHVATAASRLHGVTTWSDGTVWAVGENGLILESAGGKVTSQIAPDPPVYYSGTDLSAATKSRPGGNTTTLRAVTFSNAQRGVVVGDNHTITFTEDGGKTWTPATVALQTYRGPGTGKATSGIDNEPDSLRSIVLRDRDGWIVGTSGTLLRTADGGKTWHPFSRLSATGHAVMLPAVWLLFALAASGLCFIRATRGQPPVMRRSVDDSLTPDRPLEPGQADVLKLGDIAQALSRFLRNEKTLPPLTVAVTGQWGSGKSSLMNLLKKDLEKTGFYPVWFNAWHHSSKAEDQLLAGLLTNVVRQGVPPWFTAAGAAFRSKLFLIRFQRMWFRLLLGCVLLAVALGYFAGSSTAATADLVAKAEDADRTVTGLDKVMKDMARNPSSDPILFGSTGLVGLVLFARSIQRGLRSFGVDAGTLLAPVSARAHLADLDAKASFRLTFSRQFREVTDALNPRTLVIFIDDLDRCRPENVLEIMESINFLASSGDCFIFLGMDREYVLKSVSLGFEKVADAMADVPGPPGVARLGFAKSYLEKLINFEAPIPVPDRETRQEFLVPKVASPAEPPRDEWVRKAYDRWRPRFVVLSMVVVLIALPYLVYTGVRAPSGANQRTSVKSGNGVGDLTPVGKKAASEENLPALPPNPETKIIPPDPSSSAWLVWLLTAGVAAMAGVGVVGLLRQPQVVVKDSDEFTKAMSRWIGLVTDRRQTARSLKQFINRLRYLAMRLRSGEPEPTRWDRLLTAFRFRRRATETPDQRLAVKDADLVAWCVLNEVCPQAIESPNAAPKEIKVILDEHEKSVGGSSPDRTEFREHFLELARTYAMSGTSGSPNSIG
jgi:photosystem II stability/assembly factor-like uncharacterized protein